jgi:hypothetical protein
MAAFAWFKIRSTSSRVSRSVPAAGAAPAGAALGCSAAADVDEIAHANTRFPQATHRLVRIHLALNWLLLTGDVQSTSPARWPRAALFAATAGRDEPWSCSRIVFCFSRERRKCHVDSSRRRDERTRIRQDKVRPRVAA